MAVPGYQEFMLPLLRLASDRQDHTTAQAMEVLADQLGISGEDREAMLPSGTQTRYYNRITWAVVYLSKSLLLGKAQEKGSPFSWASQRPSGRGDAGVNTYRPMRVSFDLDDTLICYGDDVEHEQGLAWWARMLIRDEPLRKGARRLAAELHARGHTVWVYTSSGRTARWIKRWLRLHGIRIEGVVNGPLHAKCFGGSSSPSKRPHAFKIVLHVDNSQGVAMEGEQHGFNVCAVHPSSQDWVEQVLSALDSLEQRPV